MGQPLPISSLPIIAPPAPRGARYLDITEVAKRLNVTEQRARERCREEWGPKGLASVEPGKGGKPRWHVRDDAHPLLGRAVFPEHLNFEQGHLTASQRRALEYRHSVFLAWRAHVTEAARNGKTREDATAVFMIRLATEPALMPPKGSNAPGSGRTLFAWDAAYRRDGLKGLVDERWLRKADTLSGMDDPFFVEVRRLYLSKNQPSLSFIYRMVSETFKLRGVPALSYKKCHRLMSAVPMDAKIKLRKGDKAYVNECEPYAERDYSALRSNEIWNGDHHRLDVIISHGGRHIRPWITAWQDVRSRLIVGWYVFAHDPNTDTILFALGDAAKAHGVPDEVYVDNGKDYDAKALQGITKAERRAKAQFTEAVRSKSGVLAGLGIGISHCQPYHGQSKPIERFFRTLKDEFSKMQRTYCGGTPAEKPDDLAAKVARGASPTLEDFTEELNCWIADYYNAGRGHAGDSMNGQTPAEVFAACLTSKRTAPEAALDEMMLKPTQLLKIGQNGISYMGMHFDAPELARHFGKWARLHLDPRDIRKPRAYDEEGRFMCIVETREKIPFKAPLADLKAIQKEKGRRRKAIAEVQESRPRIFENPATAMIRMGAQRAAALAASAPAPSIRIDGIRATEATKAVDAAERRKASASTPRKSFLYDPENAFDLPTPTRERSTRLEDYARAHFPAPGEEPALPTFRDVARHLNDEADARRAAEELEEAAERERIGDALYRSNRSA